MSFSPISKQTQKTYSAQLSEHIYQIRTLLSATFESTLLSITAYLFVPQVVRLPFCVLPTWLFSHRLFCSFVLFAQQTFTLTIHIYEAHLGFSNGGSGPQGDQPSTAGLWDTIASVYLPKYSTGERHETNRAGKTPNPVWDKVYIQQLVYCAVCKVHLSTAKISMPMSRLYLLLLSAVAV